MIAAGQMISRIQGMISDYSTETKADILEHMNIEYISVAGMREWNCLTPRVTLTTILPADAVRLRYVQDDTTKLYFPIQYEDRYKTNHLFNWFKDITITTPLIEDDNLTVTANSTTVTQVAPSTNFSADHVGEYLRIGENLGFYKIAAFVSTTEVTLEHGFRGASATSQHFQLRPVGTKQIATTNQNGETVTPSASALLWYVRRPLPLYNDHDMIELPGDCDAIRIGTLQRMMEQAKYDTDSLRQIGNYSVAMERMRTEDDQNPVIPVPRDKVGSRLQFGRYR